MDWEDDSLHEKTVLSSTTQRPDVTWEARCSPGVPPNLHFSMSLPQLQDYPLQSQTAMLEARIITHLAFDDSASPKRICSALFLCQSLLQKPW